MQEQKKRIEAAKRRLADIKALHTQWSEAPARHNFASSVVNEMERIAYSVRCYLDGEPGPYREGIVSADSRDYMTTVPSGCGDGGCLEIIVQGERCVVLCNECGAVVGTGTARTSHAFTLHGDTAQFLAGNDGAGRLS